SITAAAPFPVGSTADVRTIGPKGCPDRLPARSSIQSGALSSLTSMPSDFRRTVRTGSMANSFLRVRWLVFREKNQKLHQVAHQEPRNVREKSEGRKDSATSRSTHRDGNGALDVTNCLRCSQTGLG